MIRGRHVGQAGQSGSYFLYCIFIGKKSGNAVKRLKKYALRINKQILRKV
jgi:hypothetical protein